MADMIVVRLTPAISAAFCGLYTVASTVAFSKGYTQRLSVSMKVEVTGYAMQRLGRLSGMTDGRSK